MLPTVMARMAAVMPERLADLAEAMGGGADAPELVRDFVAGLGLPTRLSEVGVGEDDFGLIADDAMRDFVVAFAPVDVSHEEIRSLLARAA
jgi:alcohol dehydrogenase class IV